MTQTPDEILFNRQGNLGVIILNRPTALNALTLNMIRKMDQQLIEWETDDTVKAVVVMGAGERAFCSGGDVKAVALDIQKTNGDSDLARDFFREEYVLNNRIYKYPKPYISLMNGIVMGGGKGISAHGSHRVVSETTLFAMPETNIGFFPDVGGGYFLPRCPGQTGVYLALTSKRIHAVDTIYIGFGTHHILFSAFSDVMDKLSTVETHDDVDVVLDGFNTSPDGASEIAPVREKIDNYFGHDRVEDIMEDLKNDPSPWALETLKAMYAVSPSSLKVALRQIRLGAALDFASVMTMEYRLSQACVHKHDFYEGIRAALIDKDRAPNWDPGRIEDVLDADIEKYFHPLGDLDLKL